MAISREEKEKRIEALTGELGLASGVIFTDYRGLSVREIDLLRDRLREVGARLRVVKYTLLSRALERSGLEAPLDQVEGPLAIAIGTGEISELSKVVALYAKEVEKLEINGGIIDREWVETEMIKRLALLPSREELYGRVVGSLAAPMSGMVGVLSALPRGLVSVLRQYQEQRVN